MPTSAVRLIEYFDGRKQNIIPLFQRPYRWNKENWDRLWRDILESDPTDAPHFMGAIVSTPVTTVPIGVSKHLIIDGQQRLTTMAVLLCALRDFLDERTRDRIQDLLVNRHDEGGDYLKLFPTNADKVAYQALVTGKPRVQLESHIHSAYDYFSSLIAEEQADEDGIRPSGLLERIESALKVVTINLDEKTDDPYEIFESLNGTGTPLTPADLVRNFVLMKFRHSVAPGGEQEQIYTDFWRPLELKCGDHLTQFLLHYCRVDGTEVKRQSIYKAFKERYKDFTAEELARELRIISDYGGFYPRLLNPATEQDADIRSFLSVLELLKVTIFFPILLRLYKDRQDRKINDLQMKDCLNTMESFLVRRAVCNVKNNALDKLVTKILQGWPKEQIGPWIEQSLTSGVRNLRWPKDDEFRSCFIKDGQYGRNATTHVLWAVDESFGHKEGVDPNGITIEHIMPQTLTPSWLESLGDDANTAERWLDTFGNLTLTGYNSELGNLPFSEKIAYYEQSNFSITASISKCSEWNISAINNRGALLAARAIEIWRGPAV